MARDKRLAKEAREARARRETERVSVVGRAVCGVRICRYFACARTLHRGRQSALRRDLCMHA